MRVLWLVNIKLPIIYQLQNNKNEINTGGWLDRISHGLLSNNDISLMICYPYAKEENGKNNNLIYQSIVYNSKKMRFGKLDSKSGIARAQAIIGKFNPDVIHIHGTEFQYSYFFTMGAKNLGLIDKVVVSIQGLVSIYAKHFALGLPTRVKYLATLRELVGKKNVFWSIKNFEERGKYEEKVIEEIKNVIGRTNWDCACSKRLNPSVRYHFGNETLRECFYYDKWDLNKMIPYRIFISQASYSVKGFHIFLEALADIVKKYPEVSVHIAGSDLTKLCSKVNGSSYAIYVKQLMKNYKVEKCIKFTGNLSAEDMKKEMLEANVFVSPSTIENSPNSVGEAMLLGVPVVSSNVGGVVDLLEHKKEGYVYQSDAPYMLAYFVDQIFSDREKAYNMGLSARCRALKTHDYNKNLNDLIDVYKVISGE